VKKCTGCGEILPREMFRPRKHNPRHVCAVCRACEPKVIREWNANNRERANASARRSHKKNAHVYKAWCKANREYLNEWQRKYRTALKARLGSLPSKWCGDWRTRMVTPEWANLFILKEAYSLARLRTKVTGFRWEVDHIVPLTSDLVCGLHNEFNIRVIPMVENRSKGNKWWPNMPGE